MAKICVSSTTWKVVQKQRTVRGARKVSMCAPNALVRILSVSTANIDIRRQFPFRMKLKNIAMKVL